MVDLQKKLDKLMQIQFRTPEVRAIVGGLLANIEEHEEKGMSAEDNLRELKVFLERTKKLLDEVCDG